MIFLDYKKLVEFQDELDRLVDLGFISLDNRSDGVLYTNSVYVFKDEGLESVYIFIHIKKKINKLSDPFANSYFYIRDKDYGPVSIEKIFSNISNCFKKEIIFNLDLWKNIFTSEEIVATKI